MRRRGADRADSLESDEKDGRANEDERGHATLSIIM